MGQSATLYKLPHSDFEKLERDIKGFNIQELTEQYETFDQNYEGLIYVLSKSESRDTQLLINEIFYPSDYLGDKPDFSSIYFEDLDEVV